MNPLSLKSLLASAPWYVGQVVHEASIPARPARRVPIPEGLHQKVRRYLAKVGIDLLYTHQAQTFDAVRQGKNVIITTPTASGKTLAFLLPVLHCLAQDEEATALFLYPLKALTNDQLESLLLAEEHSGLDLSPSIYDGDTPRTRRPGIRQSARIILSNPYEIHETLPYHGLWRRFFKNLRFIVIDEAHRYTGVFGSHVAQVIRRLLRVLQAYGSDPLFILASASIANPYEHAQKLTSKECVVVDDDGAPSGERHVFFFDSTKDKTRSPFIQTRDLFRLLLSAGLKTLVFTRSRRAAEFVASLLDEKDLVAPYRAGYLPEERRRLERAFRDGTLLGLISTPALELGIDIGDLDGVVVLGYPGSISAFWQEVGRAGRRGKESLAIFVAQEDILDQYIVRNPETLLGQAFEASTIDLENEHILAGHMLCAASEMPLVVSDDKRPEKDLVRILEAKGLIRHSQRGYIYAGLARPHEAVRLESIGDEVVALLDAETGELLETMDMDRALREVHKGAVYLHQAKTYLVEALDLNTKVATLRRKDVDFYTQALTDRRVELIETFEEAKVGPSKVRRGRISVTTQVTRYLMKRFDRVIGGEDLDLPPRRIETSALILEFQPEDLKVAQDPLGALHAIEHTMVALAPLMISCEPYDLAGLSTLCSPTSGLPAILIYDGHNGGIGLSERIFLRISDLLARAKRHLESCPCETGCPSCCLSPRCGHNNTPMDKASAVLILSRLLHECSP